jgi:outer membrane cobalamin receptor
VSRPPVLSANRHTLILLAVLLIYPAQVSAADDETPAEPVSLPPVVVTTPTRLPTPESEVGSSITVIPSEEIERKQERTLPDALQYVPGLNNTGTSYVNVGRATIYGVESFVTYTPWKPLTLHADYTFLIAKDDILDQELLRRPKNKASLDAVWHITEAAVLSATLLYVGPWVDVNRAGTVSGLPANGYTLVNFAGSCDLANGVSAYARINNLLDRQYENPIGFLQPGLGVYAGIRVAFDTANQRGKP